MSTKYIRVFLSILFFTLSSFSLFLCPTPSEAAPKTIVFTSNQWDSQMFHNAVARFIVENAFDGYKVEISTGSTTLNWQAMINGDVDVDIESWTDNIATYEKDVERGDIVPIGTLVPDSAQGYYVPRYMIEGDPARGIEPLTPDLKTVADLAKYAAVFKDPEDPSKGRLYGAVPGWMIDGIMYKKYEYYKLNEGYNYFRVGSEAVLFASLASAYNLGDPWVGYCYEPTWIVGKLDVVILEDAPYDPELFQEGKCAVPNQALLIVCGGHFPEKAPELLDFFGKYKTGSALVSQALAHIEETRDSHEKTAVWFLKSNDALLDEWLPADQAKRVRDALAKQ